MNKRWSIFNFLKMDLDCKPKRCFYVRLERRLATFENTEHDPVAASYGYFVDEEKNKLVCFACLREIQPNEIYYHKPCGYQGDARKFDKNLRYQPSNCTFNPEVTVNEDGVQTIHLGAKRRRDEIRLHSEPIRPVYSPPRSNPIPTTKGITNLCKVCFVNDITICVMPCNHVVLCDECLTKLNQHDCNSCPVCRVEIKDTLRVYLV